MKRNTSKTFTAHRHTFRYKLDDGQVLLAHARVRRGRQSLPLVLKPQDVRAAIEAHGVGNTMTCSMAQCALRQRSTFPHPFMGFIDWQYSRCYVVSKLDANHMPSECYVYRHSDEIAKLNDSPGGQHQLLSDLEKHGEKTIYLMPMRIRREKKSGGSGRRDGSRTSRVMGVGARLRYATAKLGGVNTHE